MDTKEEDAKHFLDTPYWLARLTELKDSLMAGEISAAKYQREVGKLKVRARLKGVEL